MAGVEPLQKSPRIAQRRVIHTVKMPGLSLCLPVKIEVVASEEMVNEVLQDISGIARKSLVEISDMYVLGAAERKMRKNDNVFLVL